MILFYLKFIKSRLNLYFDFHHYDLYSLLYFFARKELQSDRNCKRGENWHFLNSICSNKRQSWNCYVVSILSFSLSRSFSLSFSLSLSLSSLSNPLFLSALQFISHFIFKLTFILYLKSNFIGNYLILLLKCWV